jgi:predicted peptidase
VKEAETWHPPSGTDADLSRVERLVALTIALHRGGDVRGDIDSVKLSKDGAVSWHLHKDCCPRE